MVPVTKCCDATLRENTMICSECLEEHKNEFNVYGKTKFSVGDEVILKKDSTHSGCTLGIIVSV